MSSLYAVRLARLMKLDTLLYLLYYELLVSLINKQMCKVTIFITENDQFKDGLQEVWYKFFIS